MRSRILVILTFLILAAAGCATSSPADPPAGARTSDGALLTLEAESGPIWEGWQQRAEGAVAPVGLAERVRAFDYWRLGRSARIEEVWTAILPVVGAVRSEVGKGSGRETIDLFLEALEPKRSGDQTQIDLTYLVGVGEEPSTEGMAVRCYRRLEAAATPVLTILMLREAGGGERPGRIVIWAAPGFEEPTPVTAQFRSRGEDWQMGVTDELVFAPAAEGAGEVSEPARLAAGVLVDEIWHRFTGSAYADAPRSGGEDRARRPRRLEAAMGLEVGRRAIDQVYSDTVFPPRAEFEKLR